jgi:hypothetical protein
MDRLLCNKSIKTFSLEDEDLGPWNSDCICLKCRVRTQPYQTALCDDNIQQPTFLMEFRGRNDCSGVALIGLIIYSSLGLFQLQLLWFLNKWTMPPLENRLCMGAFSPPNKKNRPCPWSIRHFGVSEGCLLIPPHKILKYHGLEFSSDLWPGVN